MPRDHPVPQDEWETVVRSVPIVSVDLVVCHGDSVLLGKRTNQPAKGEWFVPGGRVHRREELADAVHRIAREEVGLSVSIDRQLGVYEHFYDQAELDGVDGKHYVPIGYLVSADESDVRPDTQHETIRWFSPPFDELELHPYVRAYLADAGVTARSA